ncbi:MAG TPA: nuclear transport factor 2 family protein, partial [Microthrixaceae bacterium]|nr:nuclear transport factor 2 family protein [Microthrixaceae bacterium]
MSDAFSVPAVTAAAARAAEAAAALAAYVDLRERIGRGDAAWADLADMFTDDVVYVDPAWGRIEGVDELRRFLDESMHGLDDWDFPHLWQMVDGDKAVLGFTNRLPGRRPDGGYWDVESVSVLDYASRISGAVMELLTGGVLLVSLADWAETMAAGDQPALRSKLRRTALTMLALVLPVTACLAALRAPVVALALQRGRFAPGMAG